MIRYRSIEHGVEIVEEGRSTFIRANPQSSAWRNYLAWHALGNEPEPLARQSATPKKLWIIGAGGFGREVFSMTGTAQGCDTEWAVTGFLNDIPEALAGLEGFPAIAGDTDHQPQRDELFICAIGDVPGRRMVVEKFRRRGARFVNMIQRTALLAPSVQLGEGIIVEAFSGIGANARVGDFSTVLSHVSIGHDVVIGSFVQVSPFASILGRVEIGDGVLIGSHAVILPNVKIGAGATVGAGSIVISDVAAGTTVFGVPAKRLS
jgi:sugar O-acyltransferase (sialic acid O-acetyltransferase NeuD family)